MANLEAAAKAAGKAIDHERSHVTELTQTLLRIPSVNPFISDPLQTRESAVQDQVESG